jgi:hypothetical protein
MFFTLRPLLTSTGAGRVEDDVAGPDQTRATQDVIG